MILQNISREDISALFPPLSPLTHKGSMGRVLCVCGSYCGQGIAMCGAAYFSAMAAYLTGAGIVEIFTARKNYEALASRVPEAIFSLYDTEKESDEDICQRLIPSLKSADSVVLGCGLGKSKTAISLVKAVLESVNCPLVIDADGLNIAAEYHELWSSLSDEQRKRTVITPHIGEMARLCGLPTSQILSDKVSVAENFAKKQGIICLLKGNDTVITDGEHTFINKSGNPGMATGGSGDVLSGIIGGMLARNALADWCGEERRCLSPALYRTACAAYIHGLAGEMAAEKYGQYSTIATKIIEEISNVIVNSQ